MEKKKLSLLSARKQEEVKQAVENAVKAGVQYNVNYMHFETFQAKIDNDEKRAAVVFLLDEVLEQVELDYRMAPIIVQLGDPKTKEFLTYREFKLLQEVIKNLKLRGRQNLEKLVKSMQAFNEDGRVLNQIEEESKIFIKAYQDASTFYSNLCKKYGILPDDLQDEIEEATKAEVEKLHAEQENAN